MRKQILLMFLLVLTKAAVAQEDFYNDYMITVSGVVSVGDDPDDQCGSGIWYYVDFENGERSLIVALPIDNPGSYNFSGSLVFSSANKVKNLYSVTQNQHKSRHGLSWKCGDGPPIQGSIFFNPAYPCNNGTITHTSGVYSFNTNINIQPLSKKNMKLTIDAKLQNNYNQEYPQYIHANLGDYEYDLIRGDSKDNFSYSFVVDFSDGTSETISQQSLQYFYANDVISINYSRYYSSRKDVDRVRLNAHGVVPYDFPSDGGSGGGDAIWSSNFKRYSSSLLKALGLVPIEIGRNDLNEGKVINSDFLRSKNDAKEAFFGIVDYDVNANHQIDLNHKVPQTTRNSFVFFPGAAASTIDVRSQVFSIPLKYGPGTDYILPANVGDRITLVAPSPNPASFYHWVFSTDGTTWRDLPSQFQGQHRIQISGYDILGADFANYYGRNFFFKLVIDCNGGESDIVTLSARASVPNIVSVEPIPDRCYDVQGNKTGSVKITFDRPLLTNGTETEQLNILLTDPSHPELTLAQFLNVNLDGSNSYTSPGTLPANTPYLINLLSKYLGNATSSDNATTQTAAFTISRPTPVSSTLAAESVHCYNGGDGKITITASGGAGNYSIEYTRPGETTSQQLSLGSSTTGTLDFLTKGTYGVRVRDGNGCSDQGGIKNIAITQPFTPLRVDYSAATDPLAYGYTDGSVETVLVGGTPYADKHYTVEWYNPSSLLPTSLQNNAVVFEGYQANLIGVGDGSYVLKAYDSQYALAHPDHRAGCYVESNIFRLVQPAPLVVNISEDHYVTCKNDSDGALSASAQGGIPIPTTLYRYEWFADTNGTLQSINQTARVASGLKAGAYRVKITDKNNIEKLSDAFTLVQPDALQAQVTTTPVHCYGGNDGTAAATVQGGTSPYTYEWLDGSTTSQLSGLSSDTYFLMVTDVRGCTTSTSAAVASHQPVSSTLTADAVHCYGGGDGKITLVASGGVGGYYFDYAPSGSEVFTSVVAFGSSTSHTLDFLRQGTYTVFIHDGNHCDDGAGAKHISVSQPSEALRLSQSATTNPRAYGYTDGFIETTLLGGTPYADKHYTVEWYDPINLLPVALQSNTAQPDGYHANIIGLGDGSYIVKAYDSQYALAHPDHRAGCFVESNQFLLIQPPPLLVTISEQHIVTCNGYTNGELLATAQGGIPLPGAAPYNYDWLLADNTGTYYSIGQTSSLASELKSGLYKIKITDGNNIEKISEAFLLDQPRNPITSTVTTEAVHCYGGGDGKIHLEVRGGVGNYSFEYFTPGSTAATILSLGTNTTAVIDFLPAGTYKIYVHDGNACNDVASLRSITVSQPANALSIKQAATTNPLAFGYTDGYIETTLTGGTSYPDQHYTVEWYDPVNLLAESLQQNSAVGDGYRANITGLGDGSYILKAYDSQYPLAHPDHRAGCYVESAALRLIQPPPLLVSVAEHHFVSCKGYTDGALTAHAQGGIPLSGALPYRYEWLVVYAGTPRPINQTDSIATRLKSGVYVIKITDKNNIEKRSAPFTLVEPNTLQAKVITTPVSCESGEDGTATSLIEGGTAPYAYQWSEGSTSSSIGALTESKYFVFVTDIRGCTTTASARVTSPYALTIDSLLRNPQCFGYSNGSIDLTVKEGAAPYRYQWNTGLQTEDIAGLSAGTYRVLITDHNNCKSYRTYQLQDPEPVRIELGSERYLCNGQNYVADASLSDAGTQYLWTGPSGFSASTGKVVLTQEGSYHVDVTNSQGCKGGDDLSIKRVGIDINSEFIVSTQAFVQSEVTLINLSTPAPDSVHWYADATTTHFVSSQPSKAIVTFPQEGTYTLYLKAYRQRCEAIFSKVITVLGTSFEDEPQMSPPFIETFTASPVPTEGAFTVTVSLQEISAIRLRLISIATNTVVIDRQEQGSSHYELPYNLHLASGTYMLLLESPRANSLLKIVVY